MSDEPAPLKPAGPPSAKSSKGVLGLLVLNLVGTLFVAFKVATAHPAEAAAPHPHEEISTSEVTGPVVGLDPFVVNLDEPGTPRYLKVTLEIELAGGAKGGGEGGEGGLAKSKQLVRDAILSYLSGLHVKDTLGAEAKDKIRSDLLARLTKLLGPDKVRRMFFQDFVVQ
jgi:flagellar FliL protein